MADNSKAPSLTIPKDAKKDKKRRKADELAGAGSLADRLRKRRLALESGDATGGR